MPARGPWCERIPAVAEPEATPAVDRSMPDPQGFLAQVGDGGDHEVAAAQLVGEPGQETSTCRWD